MPTTSTQSTALPRVRQTGSRPAWNQIAAVMSMLLVLDNRTSSNPAPVSTRAPTSTSTCHPGAVLLAASSRSIPAPCHRVCCTSSSRLVSAAAAKPVPSPLSTTAS